MALPRLLERLFQSSGAGSQLNRSILPAATASDAGAVTLSDSTTSAASAADGVAATPAAVKAAFDMADIGLVIENGVLCAKYEITDEE